MSGGQSCDPAAHDEKIESAGWLCSPHSGCIIGAIANAMGGLDDGPRVAVGFGVVADPPVTREQIGAGASGRVGQGPRAEHGATGSDHDAVYEVAARY
jgi:hypothetical protein